MLESSKDRIDLHSDLHEEFYLLCDRFWDCKTQTFEEFLLSRRIPDSLDPLTGWHRYDLPPVSVARLVDRADKLGDAKFQVWFGHVISKMHVVQRVEVFTYLLDKCDQRQKWANQPILFMAMRTGLMGTFRYYVDRYWINLQEPVEFMPAYWKIAKDLNWMQIAGDKTPQRGLTLCELLCGEAAVSHELPLFIHLLEQCHNPKFK
eukprot:gene29827-36943_t